MDDPGPALQHVLRPHHVHLVAIFLIIFHPEYGCIKKLSPIFSLHIHRVLLNEVAEIVQPKPYKVLLDEIEKGKDLPEDEVRHLMVLIRDIPNKLSDADRMGDFFDDAPNLTANEDEETVFTRRSIFGFFIRRCYVSFGKLSYAGVVKLQEDFSAWVAGDNNAGYERIRKDRIRNDNYIVRSAVDKEATVDAEAYAAFEDAQNVGDNHLAVENLRRFFEQKFHEQPDSEIRQHALLNAARLEFNMNHFDSAKRLVQEAITVARTNGDNITLQQCMSLLRRFPSPDSSKKSPLNELQNDIHPLEVLADVEKLIKSDQPISDAFEKLAQARALYDISRDFRGRPLSENDQWAFHAVEASLWSITGSEGLAEIEEDMVLAFTEPGSADDSRFTVTMNKAYRMARQGKYDDALALLKNPDTWRGLKMGSRQYSAWSAEIWHTLALRSVRRGQDRHFREFLLPRRTTVDTNKSYYHFWYPTKASLSSETEMWLYEALVSRHNNQAASCVDRILKALWKAEYQCHFGIYRLAAVLLADVSMEFGMTKWSAKLVEDILPQVITGEDLQLRAFACFTLARCLIAACGTDFTNLSEVLPYLKTAEEDYRALEMFEALLDVQFLRSTVYHNLNMPKERDEAAARHQATEKEREALLSVNADDEEKEVLEFISKVGTELSSRGNN